MGVTRMQVDDSMIKAAIDRGCFELAQTYVMYMQLNVLREIQTALQPRLVDVY